MSANTKLITEFEQYLLADGKSSSTVKSYSLDTKSFFNWYNSKGADFTHSFKRFHVTAYRKYLSEVGFEVNTINKKINSLLSFNNFLMDINKMTELVVDVQKDKAKLASGSEKEVETFSDEELDKIQFYIQDDKNTSCRDRLIILMLIFTGIRAGELTSIKIKDIDFLSMNLTISAGKGNKVRDVPLKQDLILTIKEYMKTERNSSSFKSSEFLFVSQRSKKMDRDVLNKLCSRLRKVLGIRIYPHKFRHSLCTKLLKKGVNITTIAKIAGHSSIQTTASFYINTSKKDKADAIDLL